MRFFLLAVVACLAAAAYNSSDTSSLRPASLLPLHESMRISGDEMDSSKMFFRVSFVAADAHGRVYVADGSRRIRVFDNAGKLLRTFGGAGEGPGEFRYVNAIKPFGDSVAVYDSGPQRLTVFDTLGNVVQEQKLNESIFDTKHPDFRITFPLALLHDGLLIGMVTHRSYPGRGLRRDTITVRRFASLDAASAMHAGWDTARTPTLPVHYFTPWIWFETSSSYRWGPLWSALPQFRTDERERMYVSDGMHYRIDVYDVSGKLIRTISREHKPVRITNKLVDQYYAFVASVTDTMKMPGGGRIGREPGSSNARTMTERELERKEVPHEKTMPALGKMLVSPNGAVWVERPDIVDDPIRYEWDHAPRPQQYWDVFDVNGHFTGTIKLPSRFIASAATDSSIIGVEYDADDVELIVAWSIRR